jgi:hypothetical protein
MTYLNVHLVHIVQLLHHVVKIEKSKTLYLAKRFLFIYNVHSGGGLMRTGIAIANLPGFLKTLGQVDDSHIKLVRTSLVRYQTYGLIMEPYDLRPGERIDGSRRIYHPLAVYEIVSATLLFAGDWLSDRSSLRVARATPQDIFTGRLAFYSDESNYEYLQHLCEENNYPPFADQLFNPHTFVHDRSFFKIYGGKPMDPEMKIEDIKRMADATKKILSRQFDASQLECYFNYQKMVYGSTLNSVIKQYIEKVNAFLAE